MRTHAFRLTRGQDLREGIEAYLHAHAIEAAAVVACVGCVSRARVRDAGGERIREICAPMEIVSVTGTVSIHRTHLHIALSREDLGAVGGHLVCGCIVNTTAEVVLLELEDCVFLPRFDPQTGYHELHIAPKRQQEDP
ncbi:MAG: PPC domain-containing DNA-binding protein [Christensenellales bacterium]|mgnify:CR=1 FL=1|uniref:DNA-binding protein n=1 Tax=Candidatus Avichristensenella intestinipullorum TaxID=2840693 RepID=A0A9D0YVI1_9FIRM|nr:PPC domain-containing DNA-binding protein [Christensenellales bacterium]HIQ62742.1 DNA-binding protein [Candidatus Avichristensenella intestinipullorum]